MPLGRIHLVEAEEEEEVIHLVEGNSSNKHLIHLEVEDKYNNSNPLKDMPNLRCKAKFSNSNSNSNSDNQCKVANQIKEANLNNSNSNQCNSNFNK